MTQNITNNTPNGAFELTRVFKAPRLLVWQAWSEAERLQEWWGPKGCILKVAGLEFRPGGFFHFAMHFSGDAPPMWGRFMYRDIIASERIVWLNSFSNEGCGITRAPFPQAIPLEIENTVTFEEGPGMTTVKLKARPHGASSEEVKVFEAMFASLTEGYGGTFDQLHQHLANS
jgi:uncharacterized protein YndB with AHSA1/START domain